MSLTTVPRRCRRGRGCDALGGCACADPAYGSLAAEVADAGVPGVVAMRYNVYVVTAAQYAADLYAAPAGRPTAGPGGHRRAAGTGR